MSNEQPDVNFSSYNEESQSEKAKRKMKESPFMVLGILGFSGIAAFSFYNIKTRKIPLGLYLIHTRVYAQGFVVGCCTLGVSYSLFTDFIYPKLTGVPKKSIESARND